MTQTPPPAPLQSATRAVSSSAARLALVLGLAGLITSIVLIGSAIGIVAVIVGIIALLKIKNSNGQLLGRKQALVGIILGALAIPATLATCVLAFALLLAPARERRREVLVGANLKSLYVACITYSANNSSLPPPNLSTLYLDGDFAGTPRFFVDPRSGKTPPVLSPAMSPASISAEVDAHCDFVYTNEWNPSPPGGGRLIHYIKLYQLESADILLYAKIPAGKKIIACFADGHVQYVTPEEFAANLKNLNKERQHLGLDPLPQALLTPPQ